MHEMSIAVELLRQVEALATEHQAVRVTALTVTAGALRAIVPEALDVAFQAVADETCAAGAKLTLEIVPPLAQCRQCNSRYTPQVDSFACEQCGQADVEIVQGNDILLTSVTCEQT